MPTHPVFKKNKLYGYEWGSQKIYKISDFGIKQAKIKAQKQGVAINLSGWKGKDSWSKNLTRVDLSMKHKDILGAGAKRRRLLHLSPSENIEAVMKEWKRGTLYSGSGQKVKSRPQALAIALSTSRDIDSKNFYSMTNYYPVTASIQSSSFYPEYLKMEAEKRKKRMMRR